MYLAKKDLEIGTHYAVLPEGNHPGALEQCLRAECVSLKSDPVYSYRIQNKRVINAKRPTKPAKLATAIMRFEDGHTQRVALVRIPCTWAVRTEQLHAIAALAEIAPRIADPKQREDLDDETRRLRTSAFPICLHGEPEHEHWRLIARAPGAWFHSLRIGGTRPTLTEALRLVSELSEFEDYFTVELKHTAAGTSVELNLERRGHAATADAAYCYEFLPLVDRLLAELDDVFSWIAVSADSHGLMALAADPEMTPGPRASTVSEQSALAALV